MPKKDTKTSIKKTEIEPNKDINKDTNNNKTENNKSENNKTEKDLKNDEDKNITDNQKEQQIPADEQNPSQNVNEEIEEEESGNLEDETSKENKE